jgi:hypothetical protein
VRAGGEESVRVWRRGRRWPLPAAGELGFWEGSGERRERYEKARRRGGEWRELEARVWGAEGGRAGGAYMPPPNG